MDNQSYKNCQSCGMPLKRSPNGGGTNVDGTINKMYCIYCYENGQFKHPDWTVVQMQEFVKGKMKAMGFPMSLFATMFVKKIPALQRWIK
ncbi:MAG: zinc ribbon domain-containing protein [Sphingobacteriales bacterium]|nr:zinc ribbon domain-containing protein [Sphingobacteriales bacterium]